MKEIIAVIRMNMINKTKEMLSKEGFPSMHVCKVMGRGKMKVDFSIINELINVEDLQTSSISLELSELHRLLPKRMINIVVNDEDAEKVVNTIIEANRKGNPGDGKIFVLDVPDALRIRTGEKGTMAI